MIFQILLYISSLLPVMHQANVHPTLKLEISGLKNNKGFVLIAIFNSELGFPDKKEMAVKKIRVPAQQGSISIDIDDLVSGTYAAGVIHDENDNGKLDTGLFGIPKEGFCFSKGAMGTFGPPSFQSASFIHKAPNSIQKLLIKYW